MEGEGLYSSKKGSVGFSQKIFIFDDNGKFLTLRRTETAPSNPLKWDLPGGIVEFGENLEEAISREAKEESGLDVENPTPFDAEAHINPAGEYWLTIAYKASILSGELKVGWEHDLYKWVDVDEFLTLDSSAKLQRFAKTLKNIR